MNNIDKRAVNAASALRWIAHFGHLTAPQIGQLVWPNSSRQAARNQAYVLVPKLLSAGLVLERTRADLVKAYVLTASGADTLNDRDNTLWVHHGYDLRLNLGYGHDMLVENAIIMNQMGWEVFGPRACLHRHPRLERFIANKLIDKFHGFALDDEGMWHGLLNLRRRDQKSLELFDKLSAKLPVLVVGRQELAVWYEKRAETNLAKQARRGL